MSKIAKVTAKGQTTIPREIRTLLKVKPGDILAWDVGPKGRVEVHKVRPMDVEYLKALEGTLSEWNAKEDEKAYRDL